jgi:hypothetical protein
VIRITKSRNFKHSLQSPLSEENLLRKEVMEAVQMETSHEHRNPSGQVTQLSRIVRPYGARMAERTPGGNCSAGIVIAITTNGDFTHSAARSSGWKMWQKVKAKSAFALRGGL